MPIDQNRFAVDLICFVSDSDWLPGLWLGLRLVFFRLVLSRACFGMNQQRHSDGQTEDHLLHIRALPRSEIWWHSAVVAAKILIEASSHDFPRVASFDV